MASPGSKEATKLVARRTAEMVSSVVRAVVKGPAAPAPAGWGVDLKDFRKALQWLRWRELTAFANHFGQRGTVVTAIATELAEEIGRRLASTTSSASSSAVSSPAVAASPAARPSRNSDSAVLSAEALSSVSGGDVAAIVYSFSKLKPQLPEYAHVYDAAAEGLRRNTWNLNRLQAALIGTALADVRLHLSDALPAVLRPVFRQLAQVPESYSSLTLDELRYLLHAASHLPQPGLTSEEVELLAGCTHRLINGASFARAAHIAISWLRVHPPRAAKEAHLQALGASCVQLYGQPPRSNPAHPLPEEGIGPHFANFLAREDQQDPPPLIPPRLREIVNALVRISIRLRGDALNRSRSLSFEDWIHMAPLVLEFCEVHGIVRKEQAEAGVPSAVPNWVAEMLAHIISRARQEGSTEAPPVRVEALLTLLRILRQYRARPTPDDRFFAWAAQQLARHRETGVESDGLFAEAVSELLPRLPEAERHKLALLFVSRHRVRADAPGAIVSPLMDVGAAAPSSSVSAADGTVSPKLLDLIQTRAESGVTLAVAHAPREVRQGAAAPALLRASGSSGRLWGLLSDPEVDAATQQAATQTVEAQSPLLGAQPAVPSAEADRSAADAAAELLAATHASAPVAPEMVTEPPTGQPVGDRTAHDMERLTARLEQALERIEVLEARATSKTASPERSASSSRSSRPSDVEGDEPMSMAPEPAPFKGWASAFNGGLAGVAVPHAAHNGLQQVQSFARPFNFEAFRRANSQQLQAERLRVLVPPDHFPMWPLPRLPRKDR